MPCYEYRTWSFPAVDWNPSPIIPPPVPPCGVSVAFEDDGRGNCLGTYSDTHLYIVMGNVKPWRAVAPEPEPVVRSRYVLRPRSPWRWVGYAALAATWWAAWYAAAHHWMGT
jgi:hypothetical protein